MSKRLVISFGLILLAFGGITAWRSFQSASPASAPEQSSATDALARSRTAQFWAVYRQATDHRMEGRRTEAVADYERALELDERHQDALYYLGNMYADLGRYDDARSAWERLVAVNPSSARGHARLGDLFFCVGETYLIDLERAGASYRMAHEINREETGHLLRLGEHALAVDNPALARRYFEDVLASNPESMDATFFLAYIDRNTGRPGDAAARLNRAKANQPQETPEGMTGEGDTRSAIPLFERAGCPELHAFIAGIERVPANRTTQDAEERFRKIDGWLARR